MIIDNKKTTINFQLIRFLFLFLLAVTITLFYSLDFFDKPFLGMGRNIYVFGFSCLYLLYYLFGIIRNYHYIYFTDNGTKIVLRYYSLRPLSKRQNSIEITKAAYSGFRIINKLLGFRKYLILYQKLPNGSDAKYPPVNITMLNKEHTNQLINSLKSYLK